MKQYFIISKKLYDLVDECKNVQQDLDAYEARSPEGARQAAAFMSRWLREIVALLEKDTGKVLEAWAHPDLLIALIKDAIFIIYNLTFLLKEMLSAQTLTEQDGYFFLNAINKGLDSLLIIFNSHFMKKQSDTAKLIPEFIKALEALLSLHCSSDFSYCRQTRIQNQILGIQLCQHRLFFGLAHESLLYTQLIQLMYLLVTENAPTLSRIEPLFPLFKKLAAAAVISHISPESQQSIIGNRLLKTLNTLHCLYPDGGWDQPVATLSQHIARESEMQAIQALLQLQRRAAPAHKPSLENAPSIHSGHPRKTH